MASLDEYVKGAPEVMQVSSNLRMSKIHEFTFDDVMPMFNCFIVWEQPIKGCTYTVGVDPSWGIGADRSVIHVMRNGTVKSLDTQVAEFVTDDINMHELTPICDMIGRLYRDPIEDMEALMAVECNISDDIVHNLRLKHSYNNLFIWKYYDNVKNMLSNKLGWWTNARTRPKLINKAMQYVNKGWWDISSPWLIAEMETLEKNEDKAQIKAAGHMHDDIFMAGVITLFAAHDMEFGEFGIGEELAATRERRANQALLAALGPPTEGETRSFANSPMTYKQMMEWEDNG